MKDRYDIFGALADAIEDDWIENVEMLEDMMDAYFISARRPGMVRAAVQGNRSTRRRNAGIVPPGPLATRDVIGLPIATG